MKVLLSTVVAVAFALLLLDFGLFVTKAVHVDHFLHPARYRVEFAEGPRDLPPYLLDARCTVCCLLRDVASRFDECKARVQLIRGLFRNSNVYLFENDSSDDTRTLAMRWVVESGGAVTLLPCPGVPECKYRHSTGYSHRLLDARDRIERMTDYRNRLLTAVMEQCEAPDVVAMYDFDIEGTVSWRGIHAAIEALGSGYDGIFANGRMPAVPFGISTYPYDALAYVGADGCAADNIVRRFLEQDAAVRSSASDLVPVQSAFNGLALYRYRSLQGAAYILPEKPFHCEHIGLHRDMRRRGAGRFAIHRALLLFAGLQGPPYTKMARSLLFATFRTKRSCVAAPDPPPSAHPS